MGQSLLEVVEKKLKESNIELPALHPVALEVQQKIGQEDYDIEEIAEIILKDQALSGQLLKVSNSAFFSGLRKVGTIQEAILRLGAKQVANLVVLVTQKRAYQSGNAIINGYLDTLWKHALACSMGSRFLAERTGYPNLEAEALLGGLLHDIGQLFLMNVMEQVQMDGDFDIALSDSLVAEVLDSLHSSHGYELMKAWDVPEVYCVVARDHHEEEFDQANTILTIVRLANLACRKVGIAIDTDSELILATTAEAQLLGASEILLAELEIHIEDCLRNDAVVAAAAS